MLTSYQKRVITALVRDWQDRPDIAAVQLDSHRSFGRLQGCDRQEIIDYAHDRWNISKSALNAKMYDDRKDRIDGFLWGGN
jgi:hypothetical protein